MQGASPKVKQERRTRGIARLESAPLQGEKSPRDTIVPTGVADLARQMGGGISFTGELGQGSTFMFLLPRHLVEISVPVERAGQD